MAYIINQELCSACHRCRTGCPAEAIRFKNAKYWIDPDKCISCGKCVKVCHNGCISNPDKPAPAAEPHEKMTLTCDVCVIGGGGSGLIAANKAQDRASPLSCWKRCMRWAAAPGMPAAFASTGASSARSWA